jgi:hypothetical protein
MRSGERALVYGSLHAMKAFFFGNGDRQLYGAYHAPAEEGVTRQTAVALCAPWLAEYNMTHWAFRNLAAMLSRSGFPVLRFDYGGMGDSMGSSASADVTTWAGDVVTAVNELMELSGARQVSLVGKGLGATLAAEASSGLAVRDLVLWEPVVSGTEYLAELERIDASQRLYRLCPPAPAGPRDELLGFAVPMAQRRAIANVSLLRRAPKFSGTATVIANHATAPWQRLVTSLSSGGARATVELAAESSDADVAGGQTALLSSVSLAAITAALLRGEAS